MLCKYTTHYQVPTSTYGSSYTLPLQRMSVAAAYPANYTQQTPQEDAQSDELAKSSPSLAATSPTMTDINSNRTSSSTPFTTTTGGELEEITMANNKPNNKPLGPSQTSPPMLHKGNPDGVTVLMYACQQDREGDVRSLLTQKVSFSFRVTVSNIKSTRGTLRIK